jgi:hypothetical protein
LTADRTRPLLAYALVALACVAVLVQGLRTGAVQDLISGAPAVTPGTELGAVHGTVLSARPAAPAPAPRPAGAPTPARTVVRGAALSAGPATAATVVRGSASTSKGNHAAVSKAGAGQAAAKVSPQAVASRPGKGHGRDKVRSARDGATMTDARSTTTTTGKAHGPGKGHGKGPGKGHGRTR